MNKMKGNFLEFSIIIVAIILVNGCTQTDQRDLDRMLEAFDSPLSYQEGLIFVSFAQYITENQANTIIQNYGLTIEFYDDKLKGARVIVPIGEERDFAESLIKNEQIIWVEPVVILTIND